MDPLALPPWKPGEYQLVNEEKDTRLEAAYKAAFSAEDLVTHATAVAQGAPEGTSYADKGEQPPLIPVRWMAGRQNAESGVTLIHTLRQSDSDACPLGGDYKAIADFDMATDSVPVLQQVLEASTKQVDPAVQRRFASSKLGWGGNFKLAYLPVLTPSDADFIQTGCTLRMQLRDPEKHGQTACGPCHSGPCNKKGTAKCSQCKGAYYCSAECQKADWKARHRMECTGPAGVAARAKITAGGGLASSADGAVPIDRASLTITLGNLDIPDETVVSTISNKTGQWHYAFKGERPANCHKREFIVKVQVPPDFRDSSVIVYDEEKTLLEGLPGSKPAAIELARLVGAEGVVAVKGYFYAKREGDNLRIYTDRLALPQLW